MTDLLTLTALAFVCACHTASADFFVDGEVQKPSAAENRQAQLQSTTGSVLTNFDNVFLHEHEAQILCKQVHLALRDRLLLSAQV